jgi:hypothetical protein
LQNAIWQLQFQLQTALQIAPGDNTRMSALCRKFKRSVYINNKKAAGAEDKSPPLLLKNSFLKILNYCS